MRNRAASLLIASVLFVGCGESIRVEGTIAGDCEDGADNDADGLFDCGDPGCTNAPVCAVDAGRRDAGPLPPGSDAGPLPPGSDAGPGDAGDAVTATFPPRDLVCVAPAVACMTTEPARSAAQRTVPVTLDMAPGTFAYLVSSLSIPTGGSSVAGFNLDGLDSMSGSTELTANCEQFNADYASVTDPLHVGVDNAYSGLVPTIEALLGAADCPGGVTDGCLDATLQQQIDDGDNLMLVEVSGVDSFLHDPDVQVTIYEGTGAVTLGPSGRPAPGQTFGTSRTLAMTGSGDIFDGRLRVRLAGLDLTTGTGTFFSAPLTQVELRADVSSDALTNGAIGGLMATEDIVASAAAIMPGIEATVRSVVEGIADVRPRSSDPTICATVSYGMRMEAVTATRTP